jgi:hypothetical protein
MSSHQGACTKIQHLPYLQRDWNSLNIKIRNGGATLLWLLDDTENQDGDKILRFSVFLSQIHLSTRRETQRQRWILQLQIFYR